MADCSNIVGLKNCLLTFTNCETGEVLGPLAHELATEELPTIHAYAYTLEDLPGGFVKKKHTSAKMDMKLIRNQLIPLVDYQGRSQIDCILEYDDGHVYTGVNGGVRGEEMSDTHEVTVNLSYKEIIEQLPAGALTNS